MAINKETEQQIQSLQLFEQNLQSIIMQKQSFQMELTEIENALNELSKTKDDVFKIVGNIMIKSQKQPLLEDLNQKRDLLNLRLKTISSQEKELTTRVENLRKEVFSKIQ